MRYGKKRTNGELNFEVFQSVSETAAAILREITNTSRNFPKEKNYLAALACRHSRMVCVNLEEAMRSKEHGAFIDSLSEAAQAASRTQDVLKFASRYNYIDDEIFQKIDAEYETMFEDIFAMLCSGEKVLSRPKSNGKRRPAEREMVAMM